MNTAKIARGVLLAAVALTGCAQQTRVASNGTRHMSYLSRPDYFRTRRMFTGSHIPQPVNRPFFSQLSSYVPLESFNRDRPSLVSGEQVVGAGNQSLYRLREPSTGAGPAGSGSLPGNED